MIPQHRK